MRSIDVDMARLFYVVFPGAVIKFVELVDGFVDLIAEFLLQMLFVEWLLKPEL